MLSTALRIVATNREEGWEIRLGKNRGRGELNQTKKQNKEQSTENNTEIYKCNQNGFIR